MLEVITAAELLKQQPKEIPGYFFGYIMEHGWLALKCYTTKARYKEILDDSPILFIPKFHAKGYKDAFKKIITTIRNVEKCGHNNIKFMLEE